MMDGEVWKPVVGYEGLYEVSNLGRVRSIDRVISSTPDGAMTRSIRGKIMKAQMKPRKSDRERPRYMIQLSKGHGNYGSFYIAKLVAEAFIGPRPDGLEINHIDGVPSNDRATNLEYVTKSDNQRHAWSMGLRLAYVWHGEASPTAKLTDADVANIRALRKCGMTFAHIGKRYGVHSTTCLRICSGKSRKLNSQIIRRKARNAAGVVKGET